MPTIAYEKQRTALLVVDPYNDFISEDGKIWPRNKAVADANNCVAHMLQVLTAALLAFVIRRSTALVSCPLS